MRIQNYSGLLFRALVMFYVLWALLFIYKTSSIGLYGDRFFILFDDAMISMRYAWHLAEGHGLVWNPGEWVEGYTNPLWTLYMAGLIYVFGEHISPLLVQLTGALSVVGSAYFMYRSATMLVARRRVDLQFRIAGPLAAFLFLSYYPISFWALAGMEAGPLTLVAALALYVTVRDWDEGPLPSTVPILFGCLTVAYFLRPDGILSVAPLIAAVLVRQLWQRRFRVVLVSCALAGIFLVLVAVHLLWRLDYYGSLLPNTYTLKIEGIELLDRLRNGVGFLKLFFIETQVIWLVAAFSVLVRRDWLVVALFTVPLTLVAYQIYVGGDAWPYWRQLLPGMGHLFVIVAGEATNAWITLLRSARDQRHALQVSGAFAFIILAADISYNIRFIDEIRFDDKPFTFKYNAEHVHVAQALREVLTPEGVIAVAWAGVIPYYWQGAANDILGLTDRKIANLPPDLKHGNSGMNWDPGHNKYDLNYSIIERKPDYIQAWRWGDQDLSDFVTKNYVVAQYKGVKLRLRRNSEAVNWEKVTVIESSNTVN